MVKNWVAHTLRSVGRPFTVSKSGRPVWTEEGRQYTTCAKCNRLLYIEDGPVCPECHAPRRARRRAKRRERKEKKTA